MSLGYVALDLRRVARAPSTLLLTAVLPAVLYLFGVMSQEWCTPGSGGVRGDARSAVVGPGALGVMSAGLLIGAWVADERAAGWRRRLLLTPLSGPGYLAGKVAVGVLVALPAAVVVPVTAVLVAGVSLTGADWLRTTVLMWPGAVPFALLGLLIGQLSDRQGVRMRTAAAMLGLALVGGLLVPLSTLPDPVHLVAVLMPSFWLAEIGRSGVGASTSALVPALMLAGWTVALAVAVTWRDRRESAGRRGG